MRKTGNRVLLAMAMVWFANAMPVSAASGGTRVYAEANRERPFSNRLIVKLKSAKSAQDARAMSALPGRGKMQRPFTFEQVGRMQAAAGTKVSDLRATGVGARVIVLNEVRDRQAVARAIAEIGKLDNVEYVEEDRIETIQASKNDANYPVLWAMHPVVPVTGPAPGFTGDYGADFETAWDTASGSGVVVAVVDTGITAHPDIVGPSGTVSPATGNLVSSGYTFISDCRMRGVTASNGCAASTPDNAASVAPEPDATDTGDYVTAADTTANPTLFPVSSQQNSSWHGTHVAGIIAALDNNTEGVVGGAYGARILPVRALGKGGGYSSDISEAILWAVDRHPTIDNPHPAKVVNLSLGGEGTCSPTRQAAIDEAIAAGAVVVVAAGNEGMDVANSTPANCRNVISVAATARDGSRATYSNYSSPASSTSPAYATLSAQGGDYYLGYDPTILSSTCTGTTTFSGGYAYAYSQGTSMATPHVSAAVALMLERNPALTPAQVKLILSSPASLTSFPTFSNPSFASYDCAAKQNCGAGILNARLAVQNSTLSLLASGATDFGTIQANGSGADRTLSFTDSGSGVVATTTMISGPHAAKFSVASDNCAAATLPASGACQIVVHYASATTGTHSAILTVNSASGAAGIVSLAGVTEPAPAPASSGGGGGCAVMPYGATPDASLLLALLAVAAYGLRRRMLRARGAA